ncbi:MAG TPA: OpgC domain-containing protein, partial [Chloroflexota bacterium]|nr:OpgC domain-containing protein [Chloroflexota bacterium]
GYIFGMVYRSYIARRGLASAIEKGFGRAWQIYKLTIVLSLLASVAMILQGYSNGLGPVTSWPEFVGSIISLHQTVFMVDVLMMYTFLIAFGAGGLWLLHHGKWPWLIAGSFGVWLAYQISPDWANNLPWLIVHNDMFHIAPWQFPFLVALCLGYHHEKFTAWLRRYTPITLAASAVIFGVLVWLVVAKWDQYPWLRTLSYKPSEGPLRLLACLFVFQLARLLVTYLWRPIHAATSWLLLPLGQASLYAYTLHLVVLFGVLAAASPYQGSEAFNTGLQLATVMLVWALAKKKVLFNVIPR